MDYVKIFRKARQNPSPFDVVVLDHSFFFFFFLDFAKTGLYKSIRPGRGKGDPVVTDIRCLKYTPDKTIQYTLDYDDEWASLPPPTVQNSSVEETPSHLYKDRLKIQGSNYKRLQELKSVIPKDHPVFNDNLKQ